MKDEILEKYQVRKSNREKSEFIDYLKARLALAGYDAEQDFHVEEKGRGLFKSRNIIVGDPEKAQVIFTAHYDTCAVLPFPNLMAPANVFLFLLIQVLLTVLIFALALGGSLLVALITNNAFDAGLVALIWLYLLLFQMLFGYRNAHTANDNTSGVLTLTGILESLPQELREKVCVVYFDNEEKGLLGSAFFKEKHKRLAKERLLINFDCVGDGRNIVMLAKKKAIQDETYQKYLEAMKNLEADHDVKFISQKVKPMMFPSDQAYFNKGVGVCALKKSPLGMYTARIHTPFDTKCREANIAYLVQGTVEFVGKIEISSIQ